jgi:zinc protease
VDPLLLTAYARVKNPKDAIYVRDEILKTFAAARERRLDAGRVAEAKSNARYSFVRALDNTDTIANILANFGQYERSYDTINKYYRMLAGVTPESIQRAARATFTDANLIITTLSRELMPEGMSRPPSLESLKPMSEAASTLDSPIPFISQKSVLPNVMVKLLFTTGSMNDPKGKEGLAKLAASMISEAGSKNLRTDEINKALYPIAGSFSDLTDKEMTTFTGVIHKDNWLKFVDITLPRLLTPGFREEDFKRLKDSQFNALKQDLRNNNEEELGKEELQNVAFAGTPFGHTVLGTVAGLESVTLEDVRAFVAANFTRDNLVVGVSGDYPEALATRLKADLSKLPAGNRAATIRTARPVPGDHPMGLQVEIIKKDTRATAISLGHPIPVTRENSDFAALDIVRSWLGEHRMSNARLYDRIREVRGMNYGDYAYIEYFNRPGGQFFPSPGIARRSQLFEIWIRPVVPEHAHMAIRIALYEVGKLITEGMSRPEFDKTRDYLMKNVYLKTATQNQNLGTALDSWWFGMTDFTKSMRDGYARLTVDEVNRVMKKYLSASNLHVVIVTKDAEGLRDRLVADSPSAIRYDAPKPQLADEDRTIGSLKLGIRPENVRIVNADDVFAK